LGIVVETIHFYAMGSPCEVQIDSADKRLAALIGAVVQGEAERIERKFSRYRPDSVVGLINATAGSPFDLDRETAGLLGYAGGCYHMSDGAFDITSGVLRQAWTFDGSSRIPDHAEVERLLPLVGWDKVHWNGTSIQLRPGMEIDLGGIAKEYAVDCALALAVAQSPVPMLVNFGGDLRVSGPRVGRARWRVLIEGMSPDQPAAWLELASGAVTTSGDARRYVERDGRRYSHILDPRTGISVIDPPRAVTVAAPTCVEAGVMSTLAMLHGAGAEVFLKHEGVTAWVTR
jgi:thiamine biosynthesis lipoprotein